jgi:hypothetical protein
VAVGISGLGVCGGVSYREWRAFGGLAVRALGGLAVRALLQGVSGRAAAVVAAVGAARVPRLPPDLLRERTPRTRRRPSAEPLPPTPYYIY